MSSSVYRTEVRVPGPPDSLRVENVTDSSVELAWLAPLSPNGKLSHYQILVSIGLSHHRDRLTAADKVLEFSSAVRNVKLRDLLAGSQYNLSVRAANDRGHFGPAASSLVWTSVGPPDVPAPPEVLRWDRERGTVRLKVNTVEDNGGEGENKHFQGIANITKRDCRVKRSRKYKQSTSSLLTRPSSLSCWSTSAL